jgi:hypothetical protein
MKIVIEHGRTKRQIEGAFNLCGHPDDLRMVAEQILAQVNQEPSRGYGWIKILPVRPQESIPDTRPLGWDD